jgi:hypothetical protein
MLKHRLKEPFGKAGLTVAVLALVLAMVGGAYAAGGLSKAQEKQVTKIAKKYAGKPGSDGATGPAGPAGPPGPGKDGTNGTNGTNGKTVLHGTTPPAAGTGTEGDFYIDTSADKIYGPKTATWGSGTSLKGETGFTEILPPGKTETGAWVANPQEGVEDYIPISFNIPLASPLGEGRVHHILPNGEESCLASGAEGEPATCNGSSRPPLKCLGSAQEPTAVEGNFCVYTGENFSGNVEVKNVFLPYGFVSLGIGTAGGSLLVDGTGTPTLATGAWAVTAE